ncbi:STE7 [Candida oxycetoniae]|uniref:STE7 n=1 Tax=Candida oxycetoniae TaxID=497107 RepID=A0AAI9SZE4_9ASCO|nr:STE7 [Candida oxycetoniae]KAI3406006.2 STE7 [Candida oxycetoniae]
MSYIDYVGVPVSQKEKILPQVPSDHNGGSSCNKNKNNKNENEKECENSTMAKLSIASSLSTTSTKFSSSADFDAHILEAKSLRRKNFKQLSLNSSPVISGFQIDDVDKIRAPKSLRLNRQRPAPMLSLSNLPLDATTGSEPIETKNHTQPLIAHSGFHNAYSSSSSSSSTSSSSGQIVSQIVSRPPSVGKSHTTTFNLNRSSKNLDPESQISTELIINQISELDLESQQRTQRGKQNGGGGGDSINSIRTRQTVISSISPTKSPNHSLKSPLNSGLQVVDGLKSSDHSPIATTCTLKLRSQDLLTLKQLGSGNSGSVSKVLHIPTQKTMAKKIIHVDSKSVIQTQIIRELRILHECFSPYIIEFYGAFLNTNNTIVICMEYCNCGSLDKIVPLCENKQFPIFVLKKLSFAILSGLNYLYSTHKIIHRDIKPNNVLMTHRGEFKLCDFGVSRELTNSLAMADTFVGTSMYMSPERIQGLNYGVKSDVWSMGLMLIELASGMPVWLDEEEEEKYVEDHFGENNGENARTDSLKGPEGILDLLQRIVNEKAPSLKSKINPVTKTPYDPQLVDFIDSCLIKNDSIRKSPDQFLADKEGFLRGVEEGLFDAEHKVWAKKIRKLNKEQHETKK